MEFPALTDLSLEDLVPHREGMLLIDQVLVVDDQRAETRTVVKSSWPLWQAEGIGTLICVELVAQTAGVCNGWERIQSLGLDSDQMGWLVAVKSATFFQAVLPVETVVRATAENTLIFDKFREVSGQVYHNDQVVAEVVLQLFQA